MELINVFQHHKPKLFVRNIIWSRTDAGQVKCNCDKASKGNPGESSYVFCVKDS